MRVRLESVDDAHSCDTQVLDSGDLVPWFVVSMNSRLGEEDRPRRSSSLSLSGLMYDGDEPMSSGVSFMAEAETVDGQG